MAVNNKSTNPKFTSLNTLEPIVHLWILRMLVPLGLQRTFITSHGFQRNSVANKIGLSHWIDPVDKDFDSKAVRIELRKLYIDAEKNIKNAIIPKILSVNIKRLSKLVGLSKTDSMILEFVAFIHNERLLDDVADYFGYLSTPRVFYVLAILLDIPESNIRSSLISRNILNKSGLVSLDYSCSNLLRCKLGVLSDSFIDNIFTFDSQPIDLLRDTILSSNKPTLRLTDFHYVSSYIKLMQVYLKNSLLSKRTGVNIFVYGVPGTGKTELSRAISTSLNCDLFDVASEDSDGHPIKGEIRLRSYRAAQSFFNKKRAMLLFDEVEDIFGDGESLFGNKSIAQTRKAWMNRMLEENTVPTIWVSNSISGLDSAFIRRFDMILELPVPPKNQRHSIIHATCGDFVNQDVIKRVSESESLSPAVISRAASVVRTIQDDLKDDEVSLAFESIINNTLESQGHKTTKESASVQLPGIYNPNFINPDINIEHLLEGLSENQAGRLCLYGPPGTGKTAYGHWLAQKLGIPLHIKQGSDLISKWVGGTEKNIATAFKSADDEGALLLIDEVDSFLQDRRNANSSWEVTGVNEMLTQMESFSGIFIASTNLMHGLDQAALRRFDLKVKFGFMKPIQAWELFVKYCHLLRIPHAKTSYKSSLDKLINLTPGDFAAIARRDRFKPITSAISLLKALEDECNLKEGGKHSIGFV